MSPSRYFVLWPDGTRFGPADVQTLQRWAVENRIGPGTLLEEVGTRHQIRAVDVPDLRPVLPFSMQGGYASSGGFVASNPSAGAGTETKVAWILGAIGLVCCGALTAVGGIILAAIGMSKNQKGATAALIFNIVVLMIGFFMGAVFSFFSGF